MATYWENSCSFGLRYVSWYKCLIVSLVFSHLGFWSGNLFLVAPFPDLCLLVPFCMPAFFGTCVWNLILPLDFNSFFKQLKWTWCMTLVYCPGLTCIQEGWQCHRLMDFQLGVKLDSITLPDISTESSEYHTGFGILAVTSPSVCTTLDRVNLSTTFSFCLFTVMVYSLYGFPGAGWCTTFVVLCRL